MSPCPCHKCGDRRIGCHGTCEKYLDWKKEKAEVAEAKQKADAATPTLCREVVKQIWREMRK